MSSLLMVVVDFALVKMKAAVVLCQWSVMIAVVLRQHAIDFDVT